MLLVVGGLKGGTGKTTLATNLAVLRSIEGKKVLLIDADEQKSAWDWSAQRENYSEKEITSFASVIMGGEYIHAQIEKIKSDYDDIIVDTGGRDTNSQRSALTCADHLLIPFKPRSIDIWTIGGVKKLVNDIRRINPKLKCSAIVNQADPKGSDNEDAIQALSEEKIMECIKTFIGNRKSFANAASYGLGVVELEIQDLKAIKEIVGLYEIIFE